MKKLLYAAYLCSMSPAMLAAQTRGTIADSRLIVEKSGSAPDTSFVRTYSAGTRFRSEQRAGKSSRMLNTSGQMNVRLMIADDSGTTVFFLDTVAKTYSEFRPAGVVKGALEMLKSIGSDMRTKMTADSAVFDSLGDGGIIAGYRTIHFRTRFTSDMSFRVMGNSFGFAIADTLDSYVAPALRDSTDSRADEQARNDMRQALGTVLASDIGDVVARMSVDAARVARAGIPVKTVNSITTDAMGNKTVQRTTTELLSFRRAIIPDSLFRVPEGYRKVEPMIRFTPDSSESRTSRSLHTPF